MENNLYQILFTEIQKTYSKKSAMINALSDILHIEKGAVYRRLRQDVPFTFNEIVVMAKHFNISLDRLAGIEDYKNIIFQLQLINFLSPQAVDFYTLNLYINFLRSITKSDNSVAASTLNVLPHDLFSGFNYLLRFYLFVWNYHYSLEKPKHYSNILISPGMNKFFDEYMLEMKNFSKTYYVFDNGLFRFFVDRVNYFNTIRLIEKEDVLKIKKDLHAMLDYLEMMAISGQFKETGNAVNIYISDIDITTGYTYFESKNIHLTMIKSFILSYVTSYDEETYRIMKHWINALVKISTLITLTNEKQRVLFFEKQRNIVNEL